MKLRARSGLLLVGITLAAAALLQVHGSAQDKVDPGRVPVEHVAQEPIPSPQPIPIPSPQPTPIPSPQPTPSPEPTPAPAPTPTETGIGFKGPNDPALISILEAFRQELATSSPATNVALGGAQTQLLASTDAGDFLKKSTQLTGIENQARSPISNEVRVRGEHLGEIVTQADGQYWWPARQDLDTFLSKIDSGSIANALVVKGPYSVLYGPGFSFIDIATESTPRYFGGVEWHSRTLFDYKFNGEQIYGRAGVWGGGENWGVRLAYSQRTANDYETGNGTDIPSSYNTRQVDFAFGYDFTPDDHLEFGYLRLDQTGLEFPGQVFDTDFLVTNGYRLRYTSEHKEGWYDRLVMDGYYNSTSMHGDAQHEGKRLRIPELNLANFTGFTQIDQSSTGYRIAVSWGESTPQDPEPVLTVGHDFRYLNGALNEIDTLFALAIPCGNQVNFPVPRSHELDLGGFAEYIMPLNPQWTFKVGSRGDWVNTDIDDIPPNFDCATFQTIAQGDYHTSVFERDYGLWMLYGTAEYKPTSHWTFLAGAGHAERPPTQTELYALGPFLAVLQNGFTTVIGNPALAQEKLSQMDLGVRVEYDRFRAGLSGFYSFINDYITYEPSPLVQGGIHLNQVIGSGLTVQFVNTGLATLSGFEFYGEFDVNDWLTPFATVNFVEGRDLDRASHAGTLPAPAQEPLPMIPPLEARLGLRLHQGIKNPTYGVEFYATLDAPQNRVAQSLGELPSPGFTIFNLRGYWQVNKGLLLTGGVENLFNRQYREHLDLRTGLGVYEPGINPYLGIEWRW